MSRRAPVVVEAAINGNTTKQRNPHVPRTPAEITACALECLDRGAAVVHNHNDEPNVGGPARHDPEPYAEINPESLRARLESPDPPGLLDVREPWEHALAALPGAQLIPLDQLEWRVDEVRPDHEVVVYCHHGIRSAAAVQWLRAQGIPAVNLAGGIDAWAARVDPGLARY